MKPLHRTLALLCLFGGLAGCDRKSETASGAVTPIRIGEFSSLTGREAGLGQYTHMGVTLALEELNQAGGLLGRPVEVLAEDTQSKAGESVTATRKLLSRDHVVALIGEGASGRCLEGAPIAQEAHVPLVTPSATNPKVTEIGNYIFRVCFTDPFQGTVMAKFARDSLKARRVALLVDVGASYSVGLAEFFKDRFRADGGVIVAEQKFAGGDKDFRAQLTAIKATNPDAIFAPCYYSEAGLILFQARQLGITVPILGGDGYEAPELIEVAGPAADGAYFPVHFSLESTDARSRDFVQRFTARFQKPSTGVSALGYDALMLLADAMRRSGTTDGPAVRDALAATREFTGVTGRIAIDAARNARKPASIIRVREGRFQFVETVAP
ncbi:MAG TPA: ABC transporter substrate-binding protein [Candidatus Limnocylindria bacterium]|nr:ABC transporter substrate-binding protein [Candidatus Limnocylindria bacterium]